MQRFKLVNKGQACLIQKAFPCDLLDSNWHPVFEVGDIVPRAVIRRALRETDRILTALSSRRTAARRSARQSAARKAAA